MNPYLDHLLDLVEPDGSYTREEKPGIKEVGFADVERAAMIALLVELRAIRETFARQIVARERPESPAGRSTK